MEWLKSLTMGVFGTIGLLAGLALLAGFLIPVGNSIFALVGSGSNAMTIIALALVAVVGAAGGSWLHAHASGSNAG